MIASGSFVQKDQVVDLPEDNSYLFSGNSFTYSPFPISVCNAGRSCWDESAVKSVENLFARVSCASLLEIPAGPSNQSSEKPGGVILAVLRVSGQVLPPFDAYQCCLKMIIGTPNDVYDERVATGILAAFSKREISAAVTWLLNERIIHRQSAAVTARFFGFTPR